MRDFHPILPDEYPVDTVDLARWLLGKQLVRISGSGGSGDPLRGLIIETEAYLFDDPASHSYGGPTARNKSMFLSKGHWYVYKIYGIHHCINLVSAEEGVGEAVLIRALLPLAGHDRMMQNRGKHRSRNAGSLKNGDLASGPGKICQSFAIDEGFDGRLAFPEADNAKNEREALYLCESEVGRGASLNLPDDVAEVLLSGEIAASVRIGISKNADFIGRFFYPLRGFVRRI